MVQLVDQETGYTTADLLCNSPDGAVEAAEEYTKSLLGPTGTPCQSYASVEEVSTKDDSGDMSFCMAKYSQDVLKMMYMMRSHHMLTDVVLEVQKELFHVHKVVLSAASSYFKAMFTGGLKECEMSRVSLQGICPTAMGRMIYFMYTGNIRVTEVTVCQLLPAATMFQVPYVVDACCLFLERQLDPTNAIGISSFAEQHGCESLKQKANQFIERNFTQICQEEEFLQLSAIQLIGLIRKDELNVQGEREVYNAVLNWVKYDEDNRHPRMEHILYAVRCQLLPPSFLNDQMKNCEVLRRAPNCRRYLEEIFKDLTLHKRPAVKERRPNTTRMIFVSGGYLRGSLDIVEAFNVDDRTWTTLPPLRVPRSGLGAAFLKGNFYAVGGRNNTPGASFDSDWVDRYNPLNEQWRPCSPMTVPRHRSGVAVMDELLYAVGGSAGSEYHSSVEYFDPEEDRWTLVQPMHSKRFGVGVAVVNRLLYAIGGFDGNDRLASMECYHPENNAWTVLPAMKLGRSGAGVAALNQFIYVVGGFDGQNHLASVERFDTDKQAWEMVADIRTPRSALSLTVLDGKLYAMGGFDGQVFLTNVEVYDPAKNGWEDGTPLTSGRSGHASAVIYQPAVPSGSSSQEVVNVAHKKPSNGLSVDDEPMAMEESNGSSGAEGAVGRSNNGGVFYASLHPTTCHRSASGGSRAIPSNTDGQRMRLPVGTRAERQIEMPHYSAAPPGEPSGVVRLPPELPPPVRLAQSTGHGGNPFKNSLVDINLLKTMCDNNIATTVQGAATAAAASQPSPAGICSYFSGSSSSCSNNSGKPTLPLPPLQMVDINSLLCAPGPSSRNGVMEGISSSGSSSHSSSNRGSISCFAATSPPIRIAKKREAESPNIPCTPPSEGEIQMRAPGEVHLEKAAAAAMASPAVAAYGGVKTFLPVVDFQNQRKLRRKCHPVPMRHPNYTSPPPAQVEGEVEVPRAVQVPVAVPLSNGRCMTMHKIKEAVRQKLFSPSILGASGQGGSSSSSGGGGNYQEKLKTNLTKNRRNENVNGDESSESDSCPME